MPHLAELQVVRNLRTLSQAQVLLGVELLLQLQQLLGRESRAPPPRLPRGRAHVARRSPSLPLALARTLALPVVVVLVDRQRRRVALELLVVLLDRRELRVLGVVLADDVDVVLIIVIVCRRAGRRVALSCNAAVVV